MEAWIAGLLAASVRLATPLALAGAGELIAERTGILNLGIEGTMLLGGLAAFVATEATGSLILGVGAGVLVGVMAGAVHAWFTVHRGTDQIVTGIAVTLLGVGLAIYWAGLFFRVGADLPQIEGFQEVELPYLSDLPFVGSALFGQNAFTYATWALVGLVSVFLYRTQTGVAVRGVGENPGAADSLGVDAIRIRTLGVIWGGACAGAAGAYITLALLNFYTDSIIGGRGYIAIAIVMFGKWKPALYGRRCPSVWVRQCTSIKATGAY